MMVVKVGGSLNRDPLLRDWLQLLATCGAGRVVIVTGGGAFADQVRDHQAQWRFDDLAAHNMAILAMMQSAIMLQALGAGLQPATTLDVTRVLRDGGIAIWSPADWLRERADDMTHWGATSDSLAAWLAGRLGARHLVLVKSCEIPPAADLSRLAEEGVIDADFRRITINAGYSIDVLGRTDLPRMRSLLEGLPAAITATVNAAR
jgi:aspartokinase-like uncharacterized kinase